VSIHGYFGRDGGHLEAMMNTDRPDSCIVRTIATLEKAGLGGGKVGIAFDEWNLRYWNHPGMGDFSRDAKVDYAKRRSNDLASTYTMADALFSACFLNTCLRHCDVVKMANFSPVVNTRGAIFVHPKGIVKRTTYHVFWMYTHLLEPNMLPLELDCGQLADGGRSTSVLDAVLTTSDDGSKRVLAVVNKHPTKTVSLDISALLGADDVTRLKAMVLEGDSADAFNDIGSESRVIPHGAEIEVREGRITLAPHSLSCMRL